MEAANVQVDLSAPDDIALADRMNQGQTRIRQELKKLIVGQDEVLTQVLLTLFVGGNSLIVGVPGLAKTLLIHTMARVLDLKFNRIQFTPDLMPSDITGTDIIQEDTTTGRRQMAFAPGPIFTNILLADEINRTPPKTQSALLEAMQEHRVTIQGRTYTLEEPFFVFATQNPIELEGTYPLPEAQLDRFMFHIVIEHPPEDEEFEVVRTTTAIHEPQFERTVTGEDLIAFQRLVRRVPVAEPVMRYALSLVRASRPKSPTAPDAVQQVGVVRRQRARGAVPGAGRQGAGADQRPLPRDLRRHPRAGPPGAAPPHAHQLPRPVGGHDHRPDRRQAARIGAGAALGDVMQLGGAIPGAQFVDPAVLARIGNLELVARSVVDGVINGLHRSPFFGSSVDFAEHRGYVAGDDIRRVDWRVYARTDRYFVKEFEADSNANFVVLLDVSSSMAFGERITKLDYAKTLAACLTYLVHKQRDRVGLVTFDSDVVDHVPPSAKHLDVVLHTLDRAKATRPGQLSGPLRRLAEHFGRRGVVVLHLRSLRGTRGDLRGAGADPLPRQRRRGLPRARSGGARVPVHRSVGLRGPRERRAAAGRARVVPRQVPGAGPGARRRADRQGRRARRRLPHARHLEAARLRALRLPVVPRALDPDPVARWRSCFRSSWRDWRRWPCRWPIHLIQREKKQIIAFPSLMFVRRVPYESVRRRKIHHWALLALRLAALALIVAAFARPFVRGRRRGHRPAARARWSCCSTAPTAWATATAGRGPRRRPGR